MNNETVTGSITQINKISGNIQKAQTVYKDNYNDLKNKPIINGIILKGNKTLEELGITAENISNLSEVAKTGNFEDLNNKPEIPIVDVNKNYVDSELSKKVDKVSGKVLSSNDYTDEEKEKLAILQQYDDTEIKNDISLNKSVLQGINRKNLLKNTGVTAKINGVTFTVNDDKTITANGTATAKTNFEFNTTIKPGEYIFSGISEPATSSTVNMGIFNASTWKAFVALDKDSKFSVTEDTNVIVRLVVYEGYTADNVIFSPMIRYSDIIDDEYETYIDDLDTQIKKWDYQHISMHSTIKSCNKAVNDGNYAVETTATDTPENDIFGNMNVCNIGDCIIQTLSYCTIDNNIKISSRMSNDKGITWQKWFIFTGV